MQLKHLLVALGLAGFTLAGQEAAMDAPAVKALMSTLATSFANIDKAILAISEANVATQVPLVVASMDSLNKALIDGSSKLKSSKALGILDMSSLSSSMTPVQKSMTSMLTDVIAKRPIIVKGNQAETLGKGLKKQQAGFMAMQEAFMTQIPSSMSAQAPPKSAGGAMPDVNIDGTGLEDLMFDVAMAVFKGTDTTVKVSGSIWPLPGGSSPATAASPAPKAVSSPPKGATPKGTSSTAKGAGPPAKGVRRAVGFMA
jgi:hypothetical protein